MKISKQMILIFLLLLAASSYVISGCSSSEKTPIVTINDKKLYMEDFLYNIYIVEKEGNQLEDYYLKNLGYGYWDYEYKGSTIRETAKSSVLTQVVMNEILSDQAKQKGFNLTEKEISENKEAIDTLIATSSEKALNDLGLTRDVLNTAYNKISLSDKYYKELSKGFKIDEKAIRDSINKEDYKEYKTECLFIPTVITTDKALTPLSDDEVREAYATMSDIFTKLEEGSEFDTLLNDYATLSYYPRDFIYGDSIYEKEYQKAAISLGNSEYSHIVTTSYGYYIIHMLDNSSTDKYEHAVEDAIGLEEDTQFAVIYNKIKEQYNITINFDYWDSINLGSITNPKDN